MRDNTVYGRMLEGFKERRACLAELDAKATADRKYMDDAEARIAALEEQLADCAKTCGGLEFHRDALLEELDDEGDAKDAALAMLDVAEAELAELNARRCETCKSYDVDTRFCAALTQHWHPDFRCAGWAEGITP